MVQTFQVFIFTVASVKNSTVNMYLYMLNCTGQLSCEIYNVIWALFKFW